MITNITTLRSSTRLAKLSLKCVVMLALAGLNLPTTVIATDIAILSVDPVAARLGQDISIVLTRALTEEELQSAVVVIGGIPNRPASAQGTVLTVRVPMSDLGPNPPVLLRINPRVSGIYRGFTISNPDKHPVEIVEIEPSDVLPGGLVRIRVGAWLDLSSEDSLQVAIDGRPTEILNKAKHELTVRTPSDLREGLSYVSVTVRGVRSANARSIMVQGRTSVLTDDTFGTELLRQLTSWEFLLGFGLILLLGLGGMYFFKWSNEFLRRSRYRNRARRSNNSRTLGRPISDFPQSIPPRELCETLFEGDCVVYVGSELGPEVGTPNRLQLLSELIEWGAKATPSVINRELAMSFRRALEAGSADVVGDSLFGRLQAAGAMNALYEHLRDIYLDKKLTPLHVHGLLKDLPLAGILTPNFDELLEQTYTGNSAPRVLTPDESEELAVALNKRKMFILKLSGSLAQPERIQLSQVQFREMVMANPGFGRVMETLTFSRSLLFLFATFEEIDSFFSAIRFRHNPTRHHFALVPFEDTSWQASAEALLRRYSVKVIPSQGESNRREVEGFLSSVKESKRSLKLAKGLPRLRDQADPIKQVVINDIGPFVELELDLNEHLNVFLGDNGVGKSTILRAIAVAICGVDASEYAARLIRSGQSEGRIILKTANGSEFITRILRNGDSEATIDSIPSRPLDTQGWLALGFPPLRTVSWTPTRGPQLEERKVRPTASDLIPLIEGGLDPRIDHVKQWILNLDYLDHTVDARLKRDIAGAAAISDFFTVAGAIMGDLAIVYKGIDPIQRRIRIQTADGELPLEALSQGTLSLLGWIGCFLERLHEVYGSTNSPRDRFAILLMDEIDAHMHPAWQRSIVPKLRELFPNVQFIMTTHSPLIVGGLSIDQVFSFSRRDDGSVYRVPLSDDETMGRTDQVLTSGLFGLSTTIDSQTETEIQRYHSLLRKRSLATKSGASFKSEDEAEFQRLRRVLEFRIPAPAESLPDRRAFELVKSLLEELAAGHTDLNTAELEVKASQLLEAVQRRSRQGHDTNKL